LVAAALISSFIVFIGVLTMMYARRRRRKPRAAGAR
jgi:cbb3-type cytochrome oxidase subunit 3